MNIKDKEGEVKVVKLPKDFKNKWIKALRSGDFNQCTATLHDKQENSYCCLGVACRIVHPKLDLKEKGWINGDLIIRANKVPKLLQGSEDNNTIAKRLASMNDSGKSFKYIASYIERNL